MQRQRGLKSLNDRNSCPICRQSKDEKMKPVTKLPIFVLSVVAASTLLLFLSADRSEPIAVEEGVKAPAELNNVEAPTKTVETPKKVESSKLQASEKMPSTEIARIKQPPERRPRELLDNATDYAHPRLRKFSEFDAKALRTEQEELEYREQLSDPELQALALSLVRNVPQQFKSEKMVERMLAIDYIGRSIQYLGNPQREIMIEELQYQVTGPLSERVDSNADKDVLANWMGDQVELMMIALTADPEGTLDALEGQDDPMTKNVLKFAQYQLRR